MYIIQIFVFVERERQMISYYENVTNDELQHTEIIFSEGEIVKNSESNDDDITFMIHNSDSDISNSKFKIIFNNNLYNF